MSLYNYTAPSIRNEQVSLEQYAGKVLLIVNTASKCGFTPQYDGLQKLYEKHRDQGLEILGFPCNQFSHQEPGDEGEIASFCKINYGVTFPLFAKIDVNGANAHPLYQYLTKEAPGLLGSKAVKWNFTKFLVDRDGKVIKRFSPTDTPEKIEEHILKLLGTPVR
ncbi:MAG: glutathione peroxidase [Paenibacillaceae bacterium]|jgi:glutathione peroxidase|nr:glutathione peroxidase [Paenibacillaceae bacterium]